MGRNSPFLKLNTSALFSYLKYELSLKMQNRSMLVVGSVSCVSLPMHLVSTLQAA